VKSTTFCRLRASAAKSPITLVHQVSASSTAAFLALALLVAAANPPTASAQAVAYAGTGAVNFGSENVCPSGKTTPAPCSQTLTLTYDITASGTLGTPKALTTGQPNLDFKPAAGTTCAGSVTKGGTCTVNVTFAPIAPGARNGAVQIVNASGDVLATTFIHGIGVGPLTGFAPPPQLTIVSSFGAKGIAVDASGNTFVADSINNEIKELVAVNGSLPPKPAIKVLAKYNSTALALDGAGNLFLQDYTDGDLVELLAASGYATARTIDSSTYIQQNNLAVDGSGNVFVTKFYNLVEYSAASDYNTSKTLGNGAQFTALDGMAVDGSANVFISGGNTIEELMAANGYTTVRTIQAAFECPAIDAAGNIFGAGPVMYTTTGVVDIAQEALAVNGVVPDNPVILSLANNSQQIDGFAFDGRGNVFAVGYNGVLELQFSQPPTLDFAATVVGYVSSDSPQSEQILNRGNATLNATSLAVSPNWDQVPGSGNPADCAASFSLAPGAECNLSVDFKPSESGTLTGGVSFLDNSLNAADTSYSVPLSGTSATNIPAPRIASVSPTYGAASAVVTVTGTNFGASQQASTVSFNGVVAAVTSWSSTSIVTAVPAGATTGNVAVTVDGEASNGIAFTALPLPTITGISPSSGPIGTVVTISGHNLLDFNNNATATFNGITVPILSDTATAIQVEQTAGPFTAPFQLIVNNIALTTPTFTYATDVGYSGTGAVNFGSINVCPSGKTTPAPCTKTLTLTFNVTATTTLAAPRALTYGAPNLDYTIANGSTCVGAVTKGNTCTVDVTFAPTQPGARNGAAQVVDAAGNVLVTAYIYGTGVGPRISFSPAATVRTISTGGSSPTSPYTGPIAADGNGNLFIGISGSDEMEAYVEELLAVNGSIPANPVVKVLAETQGLFPFITSLAVDGAGNVFFTVSSYLDFGGPVEELLAADGYATSKTLGSFTELDGIAIDGSGNVFVANGPFVPNDGGITPGALYEYLASDGYATFNTLAGAVQFNENGDGPSGLSLDANANLFTGNNGNDLEFNPSDGYTTPRTITVASTYVTIDPAGNLFAPGLQYLAVDGVLPANPASRALPQTGLAYAIAFDPRGNLYFGSESGLKQLLLTTPPALAFAQTKVGQTSSDSPQSVQIQNEGNAPLDVTGISLDSSNFELVPGSGTPEDCASGASLASSAFCNLSFSFKPTEGGPLSAAATLTDNTLNAPGAQQSIALTGTAVATSTAPHIASLNTTYAGHDAVVIIDGTNFGSTQGSSKVTFNGIATPHYFWANTQIYVTVPPNATSGNLVVTVAGQASNAIPFTVLPEPAITGISPTSGPPGTVVTISGTDLLDYENKGTVSFDGKFLPILSDTSSAIKVTIPIGAVTGYFHVLINDTGMNTPTFTVTH
jgi:hypothetical protein